MKTQARDLLEFDEETDGLDNKALGMTVLATDVSVMNVNVD